MTFTRRVHLFNKRINATRPCYEFDLHCSHIHLGQVKNKHVSRPDFYKKGERAGGFFFFVIYYFLLHAFLTHYYLTPEIRWSS